MKKPIINSATLEPARFEGMLKLVQQYNTGIIALPVDERGIQRMRKPGWRMPGVSSKFNENGVEDDRIYIDLVVEALSVEAESAKAALNAAALIREEIPKGSFGRRHVQCLVWAAQTGVVNSAFGDRRRYDRGWTPQLWTSPIHL